MIPMAYEPTHRPRLWVGDVLINDVSAARLGATNAEAGELTIALRPRNSSSIYGARPRSKRSSTAANPRSPSRPCWP